MSFRIDDGPYDQVTLTLYTFSGRQIFRKVHLCNGEVEFDLTWDLRDRYLSLVGNGVYYAFIETKWQREVRRYKEKVVIIR